MKTKNFNLPTGCTLSDLPGNGKDEPTCEAAGCYEAPECEQEVRLCLCKKHLAALLEDLDA